MIPALMGARLAGGADANFGAAAAPVTISWTAHWHADDLSLSATTGWVDRINSYSLSNWGGTPTGCQNTVFSGSRKSFGFDSAGLRNSTVASDLFGAAPTDKDLAFAFQVYASSLSGYLWSLTMPWSSDYRTGVLGGSGLSVSRRIGGGSATTTIFGGISSATEHVIVVQFGPTASVMDRSCEVDGSAASESGAADFGTGAEAGTTARFDLGSLIGTSFLQGDIRQCAIFEGVLSAPQLALVSAWSGT